MSGIKPSRKIMKSWQMSFLSILILPILISSIAYFFLNQNNQEQANAYYGKIIEKVQVDLDNDFNSLDRFSSYCSLDEYVRAFSRATTIDDIYESKNRLVRIRSINSVLPYYTLDIDFTSSYCIYFTKSDLVYIQGSFLESETFFGTAKGSIYEGAFQNSTTSKIIALYDETSAIAQHVFKYDPDVGPNLNIRYQIYTLIDSDKIESKLSQFANLSGGWIFILNEENDVLFASGDENDYTEFDMKSSFFTSGKHKLSSGKTVNVYIKESSTQRFRYAYIVPQTIISQQLIESYRITILSLSISLILGFILIFYFSKRNYKPIHEIVNTVLQYSDLLVEEDSLDYPLLLSSITSTYDERQKMKISLCRNALRRMMSQDVEYWNISESIIDEVEKIVSGNFVICLCHQRTKLEWYSNINKEEALNYQEYLFKKIGQPLQEALGKDYHVFGTDVNEFFACVIALNNPLEDWQTNIKEAIYVLNSKFDAIKSSMAFSVSKAHSNVLDLSAGYSEALSAVEWGIYMNKQITLYSEIDTRDFNDYVYSQEIEEKLLNSIRIGNSKEVINIIEKVLGTQDNIIKPTKLERILLNDIVGTIAKVVLQLSKDVGSKQQDYLIELDEILRQQNDISKQYFNLKNITINLCDDFSESTNEKRRRHLVEQLNNLIEKHLTDENLSVTFLSDLVGLNPKYLSTLYKDITGDSLLGQIHIMRINLFKRILSDENLSINKAAARVGYSSINTLIRWFKKCEGITPGQFKAL